MSSNNSGPVDLMHLYALAGGMFVVYLLLASMFWSTAGSIRSQIDSLPTPSSISSLDNGLTGNATTLSLQIGGQTFSREVKGDVHAPVTIVEFSDFQCPYCITARPTIEQALSKYPGKVNLVHLNFIIHPPAHLAHVAVECAGDQGRYMAMHDRIFDAQVYDRAGLISLASALGMDTTKFSACIDSTQKEATLSAQQGAGSAIGVSGTPTFLIGKYVNGQVVGQKLVGAQPIDKFDAAINAALNS